MGSRCALCVARLHPLLTLEAGNLLLGRSPSTVVAGASRILFNLGDQSEEEVLRADAGVRSTIRALSKDSATTRRAWSLNRSHGNSSRKKHTLTGLG